MMPVISASGDIGPALFVFNGKRVPHRTIVHNGKPVTQSPADLLPRHSVFAMREENGGVDMNNFLSWAHLFVHSVRYLTANGRKVLLIYDANRSHITLDVLELFHLNNIIAYALPAHTSGKTQPLDVVMFSAFKKALNESIHLSCTGKAVDVFDLYDSCCMQTYAYRTAFTRSNITSAFKWAGVWPVNATRLLFVPRPKSSDNVTEILDVQQLEIEMEQKREAFKNKILGGDAVVTKSGYVDTSQVMVLTSNQAMKLIRDKVEKDRALALAKEMDANRKAAKQAVRFAKHRKTVEKMKKLERERRSAMAKMTVVQFKAQLRPMAQRRAVARLAQNEKIQRQVEFQRRQALVSNYLQTLELDDENDVAPEIVS